MIISGLTEPDQTVYYSVGSTTENYTQELSFITPPQTGPETPTRLLLLADSGCTEPDGTRQHWSRDDLGQEITANVTLARLNQAAQAHSVLHSGDLAYSTGYLAKWDLFLDQISDVASRTPYMVGQGQKKKLFYYVFPFFL